MSKRSLNERMLENPEVRRHYDALAPEYALARELIDARTRAGLTQAELALRMGTTQSAVARMESGRRLPSLATLQRYAAATGARAEVRLVPQGRRVAG
jgi:transcriptional regulator with XRE-family HTH domain